MKMQSMPPENQKPWHVVDGHSRIIVDYNGDEMAMSDSPKLAKEIIRAVNCHEQMLNALKDILTAQKVGDLSYLSSDGSGYIAMLQVERAIAKAEGK